MLLILEILHDLGLGFREGVSTELCWRAVYGRSPAIFVFVQDTNPKTLDCSWIDLGVEHSGRKSSSEVRILRIHATRHQELHRLLGVCREDLTLNPKP